MRALRERPDLDVLIIGAGVNGIAVFRDLALQGLRVLLVDKGDFCSGTSAASSHMMHGGLRYLENGEFRLVREALQERNRLLRNAPHHVKPLPTTMPLFQRFSGLFNAPLKFMGLSRRPATRGSLVLRIGLQVYDWFTRQGRAMPAHHFSGREEALRARPALNPDILCTATWYDAWLASPERLCIELTGDGLAAHEEAFALNYMAAQAGQGRTVTLRDEATGAALDVRPRLVINAGGPWIDQVNQRLGQPTRWIGGTKGAHLVLAHEDLHAACAGHELFFETPDGRIVLFFPLDAGALPLDAGALPLDAGALPLEERVLLGTTDIPADDPDAVAVSEEETDYLLGALRAVFPDMPVGREHVVFHFSGIRPLPDSRTATTGQISRDHSIRAIEAGEAGLDFPVLALIGGKWTTFRAFAEQAADEALGRLGRERWVSTRELAIGGGRDWPADDKARAAWLARAGADTGLPKLRLAQLLARYGTMAENVAAYLAAGADEMLEHVPGYSRREVAWIAQQEAVVHLDDFLLRRSLLAMCGLVTAAGLAQAAAVLGAASGWSERRITAERVRAGKILRERHGVGL